MQTALAKLETMGIKIDKWTPEQEAYAKAYAEGTETNCSGLHLLGLLHNDGR